jgi:hypothetical protein
MKNALVVVVGLLVGTAVELRAGFFCRVFLEDD